MSNKWEDKIQAACDNTGSQCMNSKHAPNGNRYNFDMTCKFVPSASKRLYSIAYNETHAKLHCIGCKHFEPSL